MGWLKAIRRARGSPRGADLSRRARAQERAQHGVRVDRGAPDVPRDDAPGSAAQRGDEGARGGYASSQGHEAPGGGATDGTPARDAVAAPKKTEAVVYVRVGTRDRTLHRVAQVSLCRDWTAADQRAYDAWRQSDVDGHEGGGGADGPDGDRARRAVPPATAASSSSPDDAATVAPDAAAPRASSAAVPAAAAAGAGRSQELAPLARAHVLPPPPAAPSEVDGISGGLERQRRRAQEKSARRQPSPPPPPSAGDDGADASGGGGAATKIGQLRSAMSVDPFHSPPKPKPPRVRIPSASEVRWGNALFECMDDPFPTPDSAAAAGALAGQRGPHARARGGRDSVNGAHEPGGEDAGGAWQTISSPSYELTDAEAEGVPVALQDDAEGGADTGASERPGTRASRSPARSLWPAGADVPSDGEGARDASEDARADEPELEGAFYDCSESLPQEGAEDGADASRAVGAPVPEPSRGELLSQSNGALASAASVVSSDPSGAAESPESRTLSVSVSASEHSAGASSVTVSTQTLDEDATRAYVDEVDERRAEAARARAEADALRELLRQEMRRRIWHARARVHRLWDAVLVRESRERAAASRVSDESGGTDAPRGAGSAAEVHV